MSVDIKSLRIGASVDYKGKRVKISTIGEWQFTYAHKSEVGMLDDLQPIPITEELLAELGFRKQPHSTYSQFIGDYAVHLYGSEDVDFMIAVKHISEGEIYRLYPAHYLHELEAIYYHVFKKELIEE